MPVILQANRIPPQYVSPMARDCDCSLRERVHIGLINNMPDAALEDTEKQFFGLLEAAAGDLAVYVGLYALPEITRGEQAQQHMRGLYSNFSDLPNGQLDALIITGTEPRSPDLRNEVYWHRLTDVLDWAERETASTVLSCLATHSSVLHSDSVERHRLNDKLFGIFEEQKVCDHPLTASIAKTIRIPHSRWNNLREEDLVSCGYTTLTKSQKGGVGLFAKQKRTSLFLYLQGHPEYATHTLLKEYRRDIRRFLRGERETYPSMPNDYFDARAMQLLTYFREQVLADPREDLLKFFPYDVVAERLQNGWQAEGIRLYHNWLQYLQWRKKEALRNRLLAFSYERVHRTRSAVR